MFICSKDAFSDKDGWLHKSIKRKFPCNINIFEDLLSQKLAQKWFWKFREVFIQEKKKKVTYYQAIILHNFFFLKDKFWKILLKQF